MNEWVYVLTVEALVFGLLATVVTAQRMDVFAWPEGETWPVFGTSVLVLLAYALLLLLFCSVMTASRLGELAEDICHAFARSAGRLVTSAALWVCFQSAIVYTYHRRNWPLLLCQLWGTTCKDPGTVLWQYSYSIYLAVLLPLLVWCGGLQIVVAGKFVSAKITAQTSARRLVVVNVLTVLVLLSTYTVKENFALGCKQGCPEEDDVSFFDQKPGARSVMSVRVLLVAAALGGSDLVTGVLAALVFSRASVVALLLFILVHLAQMVAAPAVVLYFELKIPDVVVWVIFGCACALGLMDIGEALAKTLSHPQEQISQLPALQGVFRILGLAPAAPPSSMSSIFVPLQDQAKQQRVAPFSIDNTRRKRFMLTFGGRSAWPYTALQTAAPAIAKKQR
jgi:hypothetical protein